MANWKDDKNLGPWPFVEQKNKWGYLNNPRWLATPRPFVRGGPDDYDGRESEEPQVWTGYVQPPYPTDDSPNHFQCGHWHKETTFTPGSFPLQVPLEMCQGDLFNDTFDNKYYVTELYIDPADYQGLTAAYFEAVIDMQYVSGYETFIKLIDEDDAIYASISGNDSGVYSGGSGTMFHRIRVPITLNAAAKKYYVLFVGQPDFDSIEGKTFRIILEGQFTTCKPQIELIAGDDSTGGWIGNEADNNFYAFCCIGKQTDYGYKWSSPALPNDPAYFRMFYLDKSKWETVDHWTFEVIASGGDYSGNPIESKFALFNCDTNTIIASSVITFNSATPVRQTVDIDPDDMPNAVNIEARMLITNASGVNEVRPYRICLYPQLVNPTKLEIHWRHGLTVGGSTSIVFDYGARCYYPPIVPAGTKIYFESTAKDNSAGVGDGYIVLYGVSRTDIGAPFVTEIPLNSLSSVDGASGSWVDDDVAHLKVTDGSFAVITLNQSGDYASLTGSNFTTLTGYTLNNILPDDADYIEVSIKIDMTMGDQDATVSAQCAGVWHQLPVTVTGTVYGVIFPCIADKTWAKADLISGALFSDFRVEQPANNNNTTFYIDKFSMTIGWGTEIVSSRIYFNPTTRTRQRSANIASELVNLDRYVVHFNIPSVNDTIREHSLSFLIYEVSV